MGLQTDLRWEGVRNRIRRFSDRWQWNLDSQRLSRRTKVALFFVFFLVG